MKHKIYIPSKGRPDSCTAKMLKQNNIPFSLVVEDQDYNDYVATWGKGSVINLGGNDYGSVGYARAFIKNYSTDLGEKCHWQLDDDLPMIYEVIGGKNRKAIPDEVFKKVENFYYLYTNIGIIGLSSSAFNKMSAHEYRVNAFAFGCVLINNQTPFSYRMDTVEDLDYTLQCLTSNYCTVRFYKFAFTTVSTGVNKGGYNEIDSTVDNNVTTRNQRMINTVDLWPGILNEIVYKKHAVAGYDKRIKTNHIWKNFVHPLKLKITNTGLWANEISDTI